jgi:hypothetical protein
MEQNEIISGIMQDIRELFAADSSGHDIDHMMRVYRTARRIAEAEGADMITVSAAAYTGVERLRISVRTLNTLKSNLSFFIYSVSSIFLK